MLQRDPSRAFGTSSLYLVFESISSYTLLTSNTLFQEDLVDVFIGATMYFSRFVH
jgi:hypothetical protein